MSIAAHVAAWKQKPGGWASPVSGGARPDEVHPMVELFIDEQWVDITSYVYYRDMITIRRGRSDEASQTDPSSCTLTLNNRDGRFSPRNPTGPYYGKLGRNTPLRVSVWRNGARRYRFYGEVSSWPAKWDITGNDVWVELEAAGILRRLNQRPAPLKSAMHRNLARIDNDSVVAYWPCEDSSTSAQPSAGITTHEAMTVSGAAPTFSAYTDFECSDSILTLGATRLTGNVPVYTANTSQLVRFLMHVPSEGVSSNQSLFKFSCAGNVATWDVQINSAGQMRLLVTDPDGTSLFDTGFQSFGTVEGVRSAVAVTLDQDGADVIPELLVGHLDEITSYAPISIPTNFWTGTISSQTAGRITRVTVGDNLGLSGISIGHIVVVNDSGIFGELASGSVSALLAYAGENPSNRILRLCREENVNAVSVTKGQTGNKVTSGFQRGDTLINLIDETADTDNGILFETRDQIGIGYRTRLSLYNQDASLTLSYSGHELSDPPIPVDDDRLVSNDVTVNNSSGGSARATLESGSMSVQPPPNGVGRYDTSLTVNQITDGFNNASVPSGTSTLDSQASWKLHLGTVDEPRYPSIAINLRHSTFTDDVDMMNAALSVDIGDRIVVTDVPVWMPQEDISGIVQGYTEVLGVYEHDITFTTSPESPYHILETDSDTYGRLDSDTSTLTSAVTDTAASFSVTATGQRWVDSANYADQFPLDILVGGELMTVTAISGTSSPQTFTVTRSVNGVVKSHTAGTEVHVAIPVYTAQ
jgi:hypothetical protein